MNEGSKRKFSRNEGQKPKLIKNIITESNNHEFDREVNLSVCLEHTLNHKPQTSSKRFIQKKTIQPANCVRSKCVFYVYFAYRNPPSVYSNHNDGAKARRLKNTHSHSFIMDLDESKK